MMARPIIGGGSRGIPNAEHWHPAGDAVWHDQRALRILSETIPAVFSNVSPDRLIARRDFRLTGLSRKRYLAPTIALN